MAVFRPSPSPPPIEIKRFLGINESIGETEIQPGEAISQVNFRITQDYKLQKRKGHSTFINYNNTKAVQGLWHGFIGSKEVILSCNNGKVYEYDMTLATNTEIGTITDAPTKMFYFQSKIYFINGTDYKEYDGTTYQDVVPYVPTVAIATPPAGGGGDYEPVNLLTGKKKQLFVADGLATKFVIREANVTSIDKVSINGIEKNPATDYSVSLVNGEVTFGVAPQNLGKVEIEWTKTEAGNKELVTKNKYFMLFGPGNDTSVFLWGNPNQKNRRMWSGSLKANYFPVFNFTLVGSNEYAITDIVSVYDRQIIFKQDRTHYSYAEYQSVIGAWDYPVYDLNQQVGNIAFNAVQIVENSPISLKGQSWWFWESTQVKDERNARVISEKLRKSLEELDLTKAITFDNQSRKEYWCNIVDKVYIWNYGNDTMYIYDNITATSFLEINGTVYYGGIGTIEKIAGTNDNGKAVNAVLILGFNDWGNFELRKNSRELYVSLLPETITSITVSYRTNRVNQFVPINKVVEYRLFGFDNMDFNYFTFKTNRNPQSFRRKFRAKKYTYIQLKFENKEVNQYCTLLAFKIQAELQGIER